MLVPLFILCSLVCSAPSSKCVDIKDEEKRSFDDLRPILVDVDNDGKPDRIIPRVYSVQLNRAPHRRKGSAKEANWITLDLKTSKGRVLKSFFRFQYGTDIADYWVYALVPCKRNGEVYLIFYSGDDSTDETVRLEFVQGKFIVRSKKISKYNV